MRTCRRELRRRPSTGAEDLVADGELGDAAADRGDRPSQVEPGHPVPRAPEAGRQSRDERRSPHGEDVTDVQSGGMDPDEDLALCRLWQPDVARFEALDRPVGVLDDRLHSMVPPRFAYLRMSYAYHIR